MAAMLQSDTQKNSLLQDKVGQQSKELADLKQKLQEMAAYSASENVTSLQAENEKLILRIGELEEKMNFVPKNDQIAEYEESLDDALRNLGLKSQELERMKEKEKELIEEMKMLRNNNLAEHQLQSDYNDQKRAYILLQQNHDDLTRKFEAQKKELKQAN